MNSKIVRAEVEAFRQQTAFGGKIEDCFPAWYLAHTYGLSPALAITQTSDPAMAGDAKGYDFGLDAFHLDLQDEDKPRLVLIQAKYSETVDYIRRGFRDMVKLCPKVAAILEERVSDAAIENRIVVNLRAALNRVNPAVRNRLALDFSVIHVCDKDPVYVLSNTRKARDDLKEVLEDCFPKQRCTVNEIGPVQMSSESIVDRNGRQRVRLRMNLVTLETDQGGGTAKMYYGVGHLADLVALYSQRRDDLFSKNVRYFLKSSRNIEKSPSAKIRDTLKQISVPLDVPPVSPELFAFFHNGVTLFARSAEAVSDGIEVEDPFVLNGCQTIKTAFYFRYDSRLEKRIQPELWDAVKVPVRIVTTRKEDLVNLITINNNRQNTISYAALRANDPVQIKLEERFRRVKIFYQRQEGAFSNVEDSNPEILKDEYENSQGQYVEIAELARSIAAAAGETELAYSPSHIFESDTAYRRCFSDRRLQSVVFLTFLQNLHDVIFLVLKKDLGLDGSVSVVKPSRLGYYAMCLLLRYLAKSNMQNRVREFGTQLWGRHSDFRTMVAKWLDNYHSGIKREVTDTFMALDNTRTDSLRGAFQRAQNNLRLKDTIDVFEAFKDLDED